MLQEIRSKKLLNEDMDTENEEVSVEVSNFIRDVLKENPHERLGWQELLEHPLFHKEKGSQVRMSSVSKSKNDLEFQQFQDDELEKEFLRRSDALLNPPREEVTVRKSSYQIDVKKSGVGKSGVGKSGMRRQEEETLYQWVREAHLECLKTELIFH
jgi:serine/threonine protein kinase